MLKNRFSFLKIDWRPASKIPDTLFKHITISSRDVNFSQKSYSVTTGSQENRFLKELFNFLSRDTCVNNDKEMRTIGLPNIWAFKQYIVYGGSYLSICQRIFTLNGAISYQRTLIKSRREIKSGYATLFTWRFIEFQIGNYTSRASWKVMNELTVSRRYLFRKFQS